MSAAPEIEPEIERCFALPASLRLGVAHAFTNLGPRDPSCRRGATSLVWARNSPGGALTVELVQRGTQLRARVWGPGAAWIDPRLEAMAGALDHPEDFAPAEEAGAQRLAALLRRHGAIHLPRLPTLTASLWQVVMLQLVRSRDAVQSWGRLLTRWGEPAPGPHQLTLPPTPERMRGLAEHEFASIGVLAKQARTLRRVAAESSRIEAAAERGLEALEVRLGAIRGVGPWSRGYLRGIAMGDPDATIPGDYGLPSQATWVLEDQARGEETDLERLLAPYAGQRFRVIRLLWASGRHAPRRGPRLARAHRPGFGRR